MNLNHRIAVAFAASWLLLSPLARALPEVPFLVEHVSAGTLPPVADRIPQQIGRASCRERV